MGNGLGANRILLEVSSATARTGYRALTANEASWRRSLSACFRSP
jgi:hypothetical protein